MTTHKNNTLDSIEIELSNACNLSVIWLHGLGADGHDFAPITSELSLPATAKVRFIFPHAPVRPISINNGLPMRAWYDIADTSMASHDSRGINQSVTAINQLIEKEMSRGMPSHRIVLAGFSQGAAIALTCGLSCPKPLAGIIALSGYLPLPNETLKSASPENIATPIFIAHGTIDPIVPCSLGQAACSALKQAGYPVAWHEYPMPHTVCPQEIQDLSHWLAKQILNKQE